MNYSIAGMLRPFGSFFALAGAAAAFAQTPVEVSPTNYIDRESKDVTSKLALMEQEIYLLKTELTISAFRQEYGDHVTLRRVQFPSLPKYKASIPGYLFQPRNLQPGKKYPGLVMLHGGNYNQLGPEWFDWIDEAVRRGYVVMYPEYRGSAGFGEGIYKGNYGVWDLDDVLASAAFLAGLEHVDASRLGIFGHSRGGMLAMRALQEEPKRFKAAVDVAGLKDMVAFMSYKTDARRRQIADDEHYDGKLPNQNLAAYITVSPAFFAEKIETPVLLLSSTGDKTVPYQLHNKRFIEALKAYGKVHESHLYENAYGGHSFLFGDGTEAFDSRRRAFEWFAKYLKP